MTISRLCFPCLAHKQNLIVLTQTCAHKVTHVVQVCCLSLHEPHQSRRCARHYINSIDELMGSLHTHKQNGKQDGKQEGKQDGKQEGKQDGKQEGKQNGKQDGKQEGKQDGK